MSGGGTKEAGSVAGERSYLRCSDASCRLAPASSISDISWRRPARTRHIDCPSSGVECQHISTAAPSSHHEMERTHMAIFDQAATKTEGMRLIT